ncbi:competence protein ComJ [Methylomonas rivi]|uniref:Competence protein ComJ n=1 Tax=Methylomonas rivi TaxID=2952226 RepID=A0ABT1U8R8_9GAMM|nr:competence protein ComJ [Methylomonas sp. WSC-6]MCQ8129770.1 competence protein ComJ [Methylomonas sp. WSC-6]
MKSINIIISVSYSQLCLFLATIPDPFNFWTDLHVDQGFTWREGSVGFRTLVESGSHSVQLEFVDIFDELDSNAVRAFQVPFSIPIDTNIEVASISDSTLLTLPPENYALRCVFYGAQEDGVEFVKLIFCKAKDAIFSVLRADSCLSVPGELVTTAEAAD